MSAPRIHAVAAQAGKLYAAGASVTDVAEALKMSRTSAYNYVKASGVPVRKPGCSSARRRKFDHQEARALRAQGLTYRKIAKQLGVGVSAVWHAINGAAA